MRVAVVVIVIAALMVLGAVAGASAAPPTAAYCNETVYVDPQVETPQSSEALNRVIDDLSEHGVDARVFVFHDMLGAEQFKPNFMYDVFPEVCPSLMINGDYHQDLFMLFVFDDGAGEREMGGIVGGQFLRYFSEDNMFDAAVPKAGEGNYLGGMADYLTLVERNIDRASQPTSQSPGPVTNDPGPTVQSEPSEPFNWGAFWLVTGIAVGLVLLAGAIALAIKYVRHRKRCANYKAQLQTRLATSKQSWVELGSTADSHNLDLNYLIDLLADKEDQSLRDAKQRIDAAVVNFRDSYDVAEKAVNEASKMRELDSARTLLEEAEYIVGDGITARNEIAETIEKIKKLIEEFKPHLEQNRKVAASVAKRLDTLQRDGYIVTNYQRRLHELNAQVEQIERVFNKGYVVDPSFALEQTDNGLVALDAELVKLPEIPNELRAESAKLKEIAEKLKPKVGGLESLVYAVIRDYQPSDTDNLLPDYGNALGLVADSEDCIAEGDAAFENSLNPEDFDRADHFFNRADLQMAEARGLADDIQGQCDRLSRLVLSLPGKLDALVNEAEALRSYAYSVSEDIPEELLDQIEEAKNAAMQLKDDHNSTAKPALLSTDNQASSLDKDMDTLLAQAQRHHHEQEKLRRSIKEARRNALAKFEEAGRYSRYVSSDYRRVNNMLNADMASMNLMAQLAYWQRVYQEADDVYDSGRAAHKRATTPVYTSPTRRSGGSSISFGSSGGGSRSFGSFGGSSGGSRSFSSGGGSRKF